MKKNIYSRPASHFLLILALGTLAYSNSFGAPFVLDDLESIARNEIIRDLGNYLPGGPGYDFIFRRCIGYFTFALNYHFGGLDVTGYHLFNLAVHLGTALLVYVFLRLSFRTPLLAESRLAPQAGTTALLAALLFVVHPVQTQAITYTVQRLTSLCVFFYLLALVLYIVARLDSVRPRQSSGNEAANPRWRISLIMTGSVICAILAMFTKEIAFTLPLAALLYEACFFRGAWLQSSLALTPLLLTLPIVPLLVLTDESLPTAGGLPQTEADIPRLDYLLTQFRVLVTYLRLLVLPINQNLDYDYPIFSTFFTPPVSLSFLLLVVILALAIYLLRRSRSLDLQVLDYKPKAQAVANPQAAAPELRLIAFGIFWFFLTLAVESSFIPIADVIFEHRLYLPSIGVATAVATLIALGREKTSTLCGGNIPLLVAAIAISALAFSTWQRNEVWQNEVRLWGDVARKSPEKSRPWYNLGTHLTDTGRPGEAIPALSRAVAIDPRHTEAWYNLGRSFLLNKQPGLALAPLRAAINLDPSMANATINLAVALIHIGKPEEAIPLLEGLKQRLPNLPEARHNLAIAYIGIHDLAAARRELAVLQRLSPQLAAILAKRIKQAEKEKGLSPQR